MWTAAALAAAIYIETFDDSDAGWEARDENMEVTHTAFGNPGGSLQGSFGASLAPQTGAFLATGASSGGTLAGDYYAAGIVGWSFSFYAANYLPSDMMVRFSDGTFTLFYNVLPQVLTTGAWYSVNVPLASSEGWFGGSGIIFSNVLANVQSIELQLTQNDTMGQQYYLDNFQARGESGGGEMIPEPRTASLLWVAVFIGRTWLFRKKRMAAAAPSSVP